MEEIEGWVVFVAYLIGLVILGVTLKPYVDSWHWLVVAMVAMFAQMIAPVTVIVLFDVFRSWRKDKE